jgi:hypothetical protein
LIAVDQAGSEFTEDRVIKAGVGQFQAQRVFPVDAGQDGMNSLTVGEVLEKLEDGNQRQFPGRNGGLAGGGEKRCEILIGVDRAELITQSGDGVAFGQDGTDDSGGGASQWCGIGNAKNRTSPGINTARRERT